MVAAHACLLPTHLPNLLIPQLTELLADPAQDPDLTSFTAQLGDAARMVAYSGDIPVLIDLLVQSLSVPQAGLSRGSYEVSA